MAEVATAPEAGQLATADSPQIAGKSPWGLAWRRLRRDRAAIAALIVFVLIVVTSFAAPLYASHIAHTDPFQSNVDGTITLNGKKVSVLQTNASGDRRHADRPDLALAVFPRRRQPGP